jgi:hypothetical protein
VIRSRFSLRRGVAGLAVAAALGTVALTGCETKTGVAAFVGTSTVQTSQLGGLVDRGEQAAQAANANVSRQDIQQFWLDTLIELQLAQQVARAKGIALGPNDTSVFLAHYAPFNGGPQALQQSAAQIGIAPTDLPTLFQAWTLENALADKLSPTVLAPDSAARQAYQQLQSFYPGQTYESLAPDLRRLLVFNQRRTAVLPQLQAEARAIGVRVNPRFGTWNSDRLGVDAPPTDLARPATPTTAPAPPDVTGGTGDTAPGGSAPGGSAPGDTAPVPSP